MLAPSPLMQTAGSSRTGAILAWILVLSTLPSVPLSGAASLTEALDAMWSNTRPFARERCLYFIVKAWSDPALRGRVSPHDCMVFAIQEYRRGDHEHAMGWLQAGLCPDREAQEHLMKEAPLVLDYLLKQFGPEVPETGGP